MAVNKNGAGDGIKDCAQRRSRGVQNDLYTGRCTDEDLASSDGKCLGERQEWALDKVARRGQWKDPTW